MTIPAPQPDPDARERAVADDGDRCAPGRGELVLLVAPELDDPRALPGAGAGSPPGRLAPSSDADERVRRLRVAPSVQLELLSDREGPRPEVVWASLPERTREAVLVLLARLIGTGAVEEDGV
jgi:hypothetical protein